MRHDSVWCEGARREVMRKYNNAAFLVLSIEWINSIVEYKMLQLSGRGQYYNSEGLLSCVNCVWFARFRLFRVMLRPWRIIYSSIDQGWVDILGDTVQKYISSFFLFLFVRPRKHLYTSVSGWYRDRQEETKDGLYITLILGFLELIFAFSDSWPQQTWNRYL